MKKYKHCHDLKSTSSEVKISYEFFDVQFWLTKETAETIICLIGDLNYSGLNYPFKLFIAPLEDGNWRLVKLDFEKKHIHAKNIKVVQALINSASLLVRTTNMYSGAQSEGGAA